ncbi:MAG: hypothetical protein HY658_01685 [Actinobacteria bacterium]|nr:hypothetical protein [Actinomycetota bacterium]
MALSPRDRRALMLFGLISLAALVLWFLVLRGPGDEVPPETQPTETPTTPTPVTPRTTPPPDDGIAVVGQRNPFAPLIVATTGGGGGPTGSPTASPTAEPTDQPTGTPTVSPPGDGGTPGGGTSTTIGGHTVVLLSIFEQNGELMAQVEVDGTVYTVSEGETFAGSFRLVDIDGTCATFLFGDERFTLCEQAPK